MASAGPGPQPATVGTSSLAEALNPDGTLRSGMVGSFDARRFALQTTPGGRPRFSPTRVAGTGDEHWLAGFTQPNGTNGRVLAMVRSGTDLYIGGNFTTVGGIAASGVARWDGAAWHPLGTGVASGLGGNFVVYALAIAPTGDLYAAGAFTSAGGVAATNIARWDGTAWSALGAGLRPAPTASPSSNYVYALAVASNGDLYAGGNFTQAGGVATTNIAKWNGTSWSALGTGTNSGATVFALALAPGGYVYAAGRFTQVDGVAVNRVARWNGSAWSALGGGLGVAGGSGTVYALAVASNGDLFAGGQFAQADGAAANNIARWNGTAWSTLGTGIDAAGQSSTVYSLATAPNGDLCVGGSFASAGGTPANGVARWNGTAWSTFATGVIGPAYALAVAGNLVYAGGGFGQADGVAARGIAVWNGTAWSALGIGPPSNGPSGSVQAVAAAPNGDVYVASGTIQTGSQDAYGVARWNGTSWSTLGTGPTNGVANGSVYSLAIAPNGDLYVGGYFTQAGGVVANNIAKWNGTTWSALGAGVANGGVYNLAVAPNGDLYASGNFTQAGGVAVNTIAKWNGTTWSALGAGITSSLNYSTYVFAMAVAGNGDVYVGGPLTQAGGAPANYIARWNGTAWNTLGTGTNGVVYALATAPNGDVYAGGYFTQAGGVATSNVAHWNGTTWSALGTGTSTNLVINLDEPTVRALAVAPNGDVYAGGGFTQAGGAVASHIARWDGTTWYTLGTGLSNTVYALAVGAGGKLCAGGTFGTVGDGSKVTTYFGIYDPLVALAAQRAGSGAAFALYPNPALGSGSAVLTLPAAAQARPVQVFDALGREVRQFTLPAQATSLALHLAGLPAGNYLVRCGQGAARLTLE